MDSAVDLDSTGQPLMLNSVHQIGLSPFIYS